MADQKIEYASSAAMTVSPASLASDTNLLAGVESTAVDNTSNKYLDYLLAGKLTTGSSPTDVRQIQIYVYGQLEDTPVYPDVIDGSSSGETITSDDIRDAALRLAAVMPTNNTSDRTYYFGPLSVAALFGGSVPKRWGVFVVHNTGVNLNSTGGNQAIWYTPIYATV
jgi:hypothetical protein